MRCLDSAVWLFLPGGTGEGAGALTHPSLTFQHRTLPFVLLPFLLLPSVFSSLFFCQISSY